MSLPSDVEPDITEASERMSRPRRPPQRREQLTIEQRGWLFAAFIAFLGVAYAGPALARYRARPSLKQRLSQRLEAAKRRTRRAGIDARKRLRRLGGGSIRG